MQRRYQPDEESEPWSLKKGFLSLLQDVPSYSSRVSQREPVRATEQKALAFFQRTKFGAIRKLMAYLREIVKPCLHVNFSIMWAKKTLTPAFHFIAYQSVPTLGSFATSKFAL